MKIMRNQDLNLSKDKKQYDKCLLPSKPSSIEYRVSDPTSVQLLKKTTFLELWKHILLHFSIFILILGIYPF